MTYTTNTGRVLDAVIYSGTNEAEINALPGFVAVEALPDQRLLILDVNGSYYARVGDYIVYNAQGFVEIMDASNFNN